MCRTSWSSYVALILVAFTVFVDDSSAIHCHTCNSATPNEEWCADSDAVLQKNKTIDCAKKQVNPGHMGEKKAHCRKILQIVEALEEESAPDERVIRECAFSGNVVDGQKRTGNKGIRNYYYQCDTSMCNPASHFQPLPIVAAFGIAVALARHAILLC